MAFSYAAFVDALAALDRGGAQAPTPADCLRLAEKHLGVRSGRLACEVWPGAPWVLEHVVGQWRKNSMPPLPRVVQELRASPPKQADALVAHAGRIASVVGPSPAVVWTLAQAHKRAAADGDTATAESARTRAERVAEQVGVTIADVDANVVRDVHAVVRDGDVDAAARVGVAFLGPGLPTAAVLDPLTPTRATATATSAAQRPVSGKTTVRPARVVAIMVAGMFASMAVLVVLLAVTILTTPTPAPTPTPTPTPTTTTTTTTPAPGAQPPAAASALAVIDVAGPAIVNIWLEGCGDCMPTFAAWRQVVADGRLPPGAPLVNVAYGAERPTTRAFAAEYRVADNLSFDVDGARVVAPAGIGTFTTLVINAERQVVWRGRAVDAGFAAALQQAWAGVAPAR